MSVLMALEDAVRLFLASPLDTPCPPMTPDERKATVATLVARGHLIPPDPAHPEECEVLLEVLGPLCAAGAVLWGPKFSRNGVDFRFVGDLGLLYPEAEALAALGHLQRRMFFWLNDTHPAVQQAFFLSSNTSQ